MIPEKNLHFFLSFYFEDFYKSRDFVNDTFEQMIQNKKSLFTINETEGHNEIISTASFFRGNDFVSSELEALNTKKIEKKNSDWLQSHLTGHVIHSSSAKIPKKWLILIKGVI